MTKPTKTIPLDQYGLPAQKLELPEELLEELDRSWGAFVERRAVELAQQAHPEPVRPSASIPALPDEPDRGMTIAKWWKDWEAAGEGYATVWVATIWTVVMSLLSTGFIAGVFLDFQEVADVAPFWASLFLLLNPLWWSFLADAFKKKGRWWVTIPLLATVAWLLHAYGLECDEYHGYSDYYRDVYHSLSVHFEGSEKFWYFASTFLLFLPTRLAWFWKKNRYKAKLREAKEKAARIEEEWKKSVASYERDSAAELARRRGEIAIDPAQLLAFLQESELVLWKKPKDAWVARLQEITHGIAKGRAYLATVREHEADGDPLSIDEEFVRSHIQTLEDERRQIIKLQDQVEGSQEAFKHVAKRVGVKLDKRKAEEEILAWARKTTADHNIAAISHERSRVVLQASVVWWQRLLRHQDAALEAARELRELDAGGSVPLTDEQHSEYADLEVARTIIDKEPEV